MATHKIPTPWGQSEPLSSTEAPITLGTVGVGFDLPPPCSPNCTPSFSPGGHWPPPGSHAQAGSPRFLPPLPLWMPSAFQSCRCVLLGLLAPLSYLPAVTSWAPTPAASVQMAWAPLCLPAAYSCPSNIAFSTDRRIDLKGNPDSSLLYYIAPFCLEGATQACRSVLAPPHSEARGPPAFSIHMQPTN